MQPIYTYTYETISNLLFGGQPDPSSFEHLVTVEVSTLASILAIALPVIAVICACKKLMNIWR